MPRLTYAQLRQGTMSAENLQRLFTVITDDRTAALAIWYVTLHDANEEKINEASEILKDAKPWRKSDNY